MTKALSFRNLVLFLACLLVASGAFAFDGMSATFDSASWNVDKAHGSILTVKGPSGVFVRSEFGAGDTPTFSVWDKAGYALPDGQYTWQLSLNAAKLVRGEDAPGARGEVYSGTFRIENGGLLVPKASDRDSDSVTKDQVILDDLIVDGSLCVGMDCVNGESFGFDTIRLKENNLRIKFDDTSNSGSFPNNDWQLTANDSSNGGANKFSIDDITSGRTPFTIEAGAPANAAYVSDAGDLGLGTASPVVDIHAVDGNSPTLRLEQDGSNGFTPQTWDLAGNEANFFIRDVTNSSKLPFRIEPGTPTNALYLDSTGNVGIGTSSPGSNLQVTGSTSVDVTAQAAGPARFNLQNTTATTGKTWTLNSTNNGTLTISTGSTEFQVAPSTGDVTILGLAGQAANTHVCVNASGQLCICGSC